MSASGIELADTAEEIVAGVALTLAATSDELVSVWARDCDHFSGPARARLQAIYAEALSKFAPMGRAG